MQSHPGKADTLLFQFVHQFRGEMQPGRRGSRRPRLRGVHRLVAIGVLKALVNIRWERHLSMLFEVRLNRLFKPDQAPRAFQQLGNLNSWPVF